MMASADSDVGGTVGCTEKGIPMKKGMTHSSGSQNLNGLQHRATPPVGFSPVPPQPTSSKPRLSSMNEEEEMEGESFDNELSAEAQAHNISMFLSSSTSDSGEEHEPTASSTSTVITNVYRDPLAFCMDGIEEMARQILKTGKLTISGEPGDMSKVQPAMFSLQASEKDLGQLIPQLMQMPLFYHREPRQTSLMEDFDEDESFMTVLDQDEALSNGNLRVAVPVDTAIYTLLRSHCAKGARQAEEAINTAMRDTYIPSHHGAFASMPPIVKFNSAPRRHSSISQSSKNGSANQLTPDTIREELVSRKQISSSSISTDEWSTTNSAKLSTVSSVSHTSFGSLPGSSEASDTNLAHGEEVMNRSTSPYNADGVIPSHYTHRLLSRSASSDVTQRKGSIKEESSESTLTPDSASSARPTTPKHRAVDRTMSASRGRKTSTVEPPDLKPRARSRGDSMASETSQAADSALLVPGSRWNTSILENNTIVAQYGSVPYPIVWWEPSFKIDFRLSSSVGLLSGTVMGIDPLIPEVTLKVFNNSPRQIGFAIRSHRQSSIFSSHVVYPTKGLHVLEPHKMWEDNVEFITTNPGSVEMFVIDLFFCTLDEKPVWNVVRKYAIMKAQKSPNIRRQSKRRQSHLQLPGGRDAKGDNLEVVLSHGLQCVVKGKLPEAEIIFSQALYLPDFQRVPLKAFVCICLAVVANKRMKEGAATTLIPVMVAVESASKLVSICEEGPGTPKMPYTIQLVKQLKKELNLQKLMKDFRRTGHQRTKHREDTVVEEFKDITPESGGELDHKQTIMTIPPGALTTPTTISLSLAGSRQLISMLKASGWSKIVQIATAIHIDCNPPLDHFKKPIHIKTKLPEGTKLGKNSLMRLMHSNYLRHWEDITDDVLSKISVSGEDVFIETNLPGWLAVSVIQFDASMIAQMVLKSISIEPIMLKLSVFGFIDTERKSIQMAIFAVPCKANEEPIHKEVDKPDNFIPISFPHVVQAFPNEKLQLEIQGTFEPDVGLGDNSLTFKMDVQQKHNQIHTLWVKSTCTSDLPPSGKLSVSSCRDNSNKWENIANISLSMRTNLCSSSSPKESTSSGE